MHHSALEAICDRLLSSFAFNFNLRRYTKGEVVYHAAAVGIVYNPSNETQRHITDDPDSNDVAEGNSDDILCMAGPSAWSVKRTMYSISCWSSTRSK
jgi:hypothetical protein